MLTVYRHTFGAYVADAFFAAPVKKGRRRILLVPEQKTVLAEAHVAAVFPHMAAEGSEVSNFPRLANTFFRSLGGLCYRYADKAAASLFLWRALCELTPLMHTPRNARRAAAVEEFSAAFGELEALGAGEGEMEAVARRLPMGDRLRERLEDLALVRQTYLGELHEKFGLAAEDLDRLTLLLQKVPFFADADFVIEGFTSFTGQQMKILAELMRHSDVILLLPYPESPYRQRCFAEEEETLSALARLAEKAGVSFRVLSLPDAQEKPLFRYIRENLFRADRAFAPCPKGVGAGDTLRFFCAPDPYAAAAFIAADIKKKVLSGARYRDFAIVARRTEPYTGVLDTALAEEGIPLFLSAREGVDGFELIKMISSVYAIFTRNFRREDVLTYLKCRFSGIPEEEIDLFELYTDRWHISGPLFLRREDWRMNPLGYTAQKTGQNEETLAAVNRVRKAFYLPLARFEETAKGKHPVRKHATLLFEFLRQLQAEEQLRERAVRAKAEGREAEADRLSRLMGAVLDTLDLAVEVMEDTPLSMEEFAEILSLLFATVDLGQIPTSADEVTAGDADTLRTAPTKFIYLLGVNEGIFPAEVRENSLFSMAERKKLEELGFPISPSGDVAVRASREEFCFLRALLSAGEQATLISCRQNAAGEALRPGQVWEKLLNMTGLSASDTEALSPLSRVYSPLAALSAYEAGLSPTDRAIARVLSGDATFARVARMKELPLAQQQCTVSPDMAQNLFPSRLSMTQSRLDSYQDCPFGYYARYILRLSEHAPASFDAAGIGSLLHALLEALIKQAQKRRIPFGKIPKEELPALVEAACEDYLCEICPDMAPSSPRREHLLARLRRTGLLLAEELHEEFSQSKFTPVFAELSIGKEGGPSPVVFSMKNGRQICLYGIVDRVDAYRDEKGDTYIRVVDYKTGTKKFALSDIARGRNIQMLLYLLSLWKSNDPTFLEALGAEEGRVFPAGVLYMAASPNDIPLSAPEAPEEVRKKAREKMVRSGLLLQDEEVLRAMDENLDGHYIPVKTDKTGAIRWDDTFFTLEKMGIIASELEKAVVGVGEKMCTGCANAAPADPKANHGRNPCQVCSMKPFCRSARKNEAVH